VTFVNRNPMTMTCAAQVLSARLPATIRRAQARAGMHESLFGEGLAAELAKVLLAYTNLQAVDAPILFKRTRPAAILGVSVRSIDRLLSRLVVLGWVRRLRQVRHAPGQWGCTRIAWQGWVLRDVLKMEEPREQRAKEPVQPSAHRATDMARNSLTPPTEEVLRRNPPQAEALETKKPHGAARIPETLLAAMREFSLSPAQVCWLMAKCKAQGTWLQDVLAVEAQSLRKHALTGRRACAWVVSLVQGGTDYAWVARQKASEETQQKRALRLRTRDERLAAKLFAPGATLPNGATVQHCADGFVFSKTSHDSLQGIPARALLHAVTAHRSWLRARLRGVAAPSWAIPGTATKPSAVSARAVAIQCLGELRRTLRQPRAGAAQA
jgi:hypothetical protein